MATDENRSSMIQEFYRAANIFITGGTGFMGKVLLEKLLRSCSNINNIYLLIRSKKDKDVETRLKELFEEPLFAKLRSEQPRFRDKVVAVEGDCEERALGLNDFDKKRLLVSVDVVFHLAATVRFEERLRTAVNINVRGTLDLLQLCKECVHLKSVIYLTTIYSQGYQLHVDEEFYDCPLSAENIIHLVACLEDDVLTKITPALLNGWPNTYSLTKAIAEASVKAHGKELPIGIFRPGIVMSTYAEPFPGWVDNLNGGTPYTLNIALGMLHVSPTNPSYETSFVPCDMTINAIIASAWDVHQRRKLYWRHQFAKALLTALVLAAVSFTFSISIYTAGVIWFGVLFYTVKSFSTSK
ncbi:fatty acyl-CoA reductase wat-like isoform X4 [Periplaneta americana]|uniref:fatty acyl-CoA reductase wat-like isoform X4 n=1 Tax=Periplaneta americana TaxID=6978 RepID=UPI0037E88157